MIEIECPLTESSINKMFVRKRLENRNKNRKKLSQFCFLKIFIPV